MSLISACRKRLGLNRLAKFAELQIPSARLLHGVAVREELWDASEHPGGDHNYDVQITSLVIDRFRVVAPAMRRHGWLPVASLRILEWLESRFAESQSLCLIPAGDGRLL